MLVQRNNNAHALIMVIDMSESHAGIVIVSIMCSVIFFYIKVQKIGLKTKQTIIQKPGLKSRHPLLDPKAI